MSFDAVIRTPVYLQVVAQLREAILAGRFTPGDRLPTERELAVQFGVSRTSVREALRALEAQGFVAQGPSTARTVVAPGLSEALRESVANLLRLQQIPVEDLVAFRCVIESAAVEGAARLRPDEALADAAAAHEAMCAVAATGQAEAFEAADVRFHVALAAASGNQAIHVVMLAVRDAIARYLLDRMRRHHDLPSGLASLCEQHAAILAAVQAGDGPAAASLVRTHIEGFAHGWLDR